jgi:hypothetical protein
VDPLTPNFAIVSVYHTGQVEVSLITENDVVRPGS